MSTKYILRQDNEFYDQLDDLNDAIELAEQFLGGVSDDQRTTFTLKNEAGYLMAAVSNRRIIGTFTKQQWGGRKNDEALNIGEESFDATDAILLMTHKDLVELDDHDESTDEVGRQHIGWNGPCEVRIVDEVCAYFGVSHVQEITPEALAYAVSRVKPQVPVLASVTLQFEVKLRLLPVGSIEQFIKDMSHSITSNTVGVVVTDTNVIQQQDLGAAA